MLEVILDFRSMVRGNRVLSRASKFVLHLAYFHGVVLAAVDHMHCMNLAFQTGGEEPTDVTQSAPFVAAPVESRDPWIKSLVSL